MRFNKSNVKSCTWAEATPTINTNGQMKELSAALPKRTQGYWWMDGKKNTSQQCALIGQKAYPGLYQKKWGDLIEAFKYVRLLERRGHFRRVCCDTTKAKGFKLKGDIQIRYKEKILK